MTSAENNLGGETTVRHSSRSNLHAQAVSVAKALTLLVLLFVCLNVLGADPTLDEVFIKPSGGDYASMSNWEAGEDDTGDLVSRNVYHVAWIDGTWSAPDTTSTTVDGWTTSATCYIAIIATNTARHHGLWSSSHYHMTNSLLVLGNKEDYIFVEGLQFKGYVCFRSDVGVSATVKSCIALGGASGSGSIGFDLRGSGTSTIDNSVVANFTAGTTDYGFYLTSGTITTRNCTVYNCENYGFYRAGGTIRATNCIAQACADGFSISGGDYNISDVASDAPGSNSKQATVTFTDASNGDLHQNDSDAKDCGYDLSSVFTVDIDGETRPTGAGTWDIGADEYIAAGGTFVPSATPIQRVIMY